MLSHIFFNKNLDIYRQNEDDDSSNLNRLSNHTLTLIYKIIFTKFRFYKLAAQYILSNI